MVQPSSLKKFLEGFSPIAKLSGPIIIKIVISLFCTLLFSMIVDANDLISPSDRDLASMVFFVLFMLAFLLPRGGGNHSSAYDQVVEMRSQLRVANNSKNIVGAISIMIAVSSVYFAAQTVLYASSNLQETNYSRSLEASKREADSQLSTLEREFAQRQFSQSNEELVTFKAKREALAETSARLSKEIIIAMASSENVNSDGTVKQIFIFQFVSNIFVRLGTLGIMLLLFGVAIRQFRRYDRQILELRQVHLAISLAKSGISFADLKAIRESVIIDDDAKADEKNSVDKAFMEGYTGYITALAERAKAVMENKTSELKQ